MNDRRKADRVRILSSGMIIFGGNEILCTVRDLSRNGACLGVQTTAGLPALFQVLIEGQALKNCRVMWRGETMLGVSFR
jgi:hypothetical protein